MLDWCVRSDINYCAKAKEQVTQVRGNRTKRSEQEKTVEPLLRSGLFSFSFSFSKSTFSGCCRVPLSQHFSIMTQPRRE